MSSSGSTTGESDLDSAALLEPLASELFEFSDIASLLMDEMTESASDIFVFFVFVICVVLEKLANSFVVASKRA